MYTAHIQFFDIHPSALELKVCDPAGHLAEASTQVLLTLQASHIIVKLNLESPLIHLKMAAGISVEDLSPLISIMPWVPTPGPDT